MSILLQTQAPCPEIPNVSDLFVTASADGSDAALTIKLILTDSFACAFHFARLGFRILLLIEFAI